MCIRDRFLRYLSLEGRAGATPFATFLVPMPQLFELFVARLLAEAAATQPRYQVAAQAPIYLDEAQRLPRQPDIVVRRDSRDILVLDTKYKVYGGRPHPDDVHQMSAYCNALGVGRGVLAVSYTHLSTAATLDVSDLFLVSPLPGQRNIYQTLGHQMAVASLEWSNSLRRAPRQGSLSRDSNRVSYASRCFPRLWSCLLYTSRCV